MDDYDYEKRAVDNAMDCIGPTLMFRNDETIMAFVRLAISSAYLSGKEDQARFMREEAERSLRV